MRASSRPARSPFSASGFAATLLRLGLIAILSTPAAPPAIAATGTHPIKNHSWQYANDPAQPMAIAIPCPDCPPDLTITCQRRHSGLLQLHLPVATVANGRAGASKQVRLMIAGHIQQRRSITIQSNAGYTPTFDLATDDPLLPRLSTGGLLQINFYGERSFVGLGGAREQIARLLAVCRPTDTPVPGNHCTWTITLACSPNRAAAEARATNIPGAFVRSTWRGYCALLATDNLARAKSRAKSLSARLKRSCLP